MTNIQPFISNKLSGAAINSDELVSDRQVKSVKTRGTSQGGWSQARYQRHLENFHLHHIKEVVDALDRIVQQEGITQILISCDEVTLPLLREHDRPR